MFPWIESTIPRAESDAWARTSYDGMIVIIVSLDVTCVSCSQAGEAAESRNRC